MSKRIIASAVLGVALLVGTIAPAQAGKAARGTSGRAVAASHVRTSAATARLANLKVFATPVLSYTSKTCVISLSSIPDGSVVNSVTGCGVKVRFSVPMQRLTVPTSFNNWGSPPNTETATPGVLYSQGEDSVVLTYSATKRIVGVEAEPNLFTTQTIDAQFRRLNGSALGTISRSTTAPNGALLFAGKVKSTKKAARVKTLTISCVGTSGFAIARLRVS